ncbi:TetR/AcrR family transcriptional regulator [Natranaerobius trueperi]|uniref:HTH tetR-type domain-containing protein n=1 Tax=Natranaerobius trueperi TaxID=759412 RepID=A0A226BXY7_9FIRM|nr:TetR/AcrR family transcriptional regulator [Natranaerobius trueperi]OWZ83000.1 hypothetical protein CDO51_10900 [Natranaerobius trueperi]
MKKQQIIEAATKVFGIKGYQDTKIEEVAKEAEVAKGSVYLYFKSKEDLFVEMIKDGVTKYKDLKVSVLDKDLPLIDKLRLLLKEETKFLWANQEIARFLVSSDVVTQKTLFDWLLQVREIFVDKFKAEFQKGIERGEVEPGDPTLYTRIFRGVEHQVICYYILIDGKKPDDELIENSLYVLTKGFF